MPEKTRKLIQPKYFSRFHCLGSKCEDNCCIGFCRIVVDRASYQRYEKLNDPETRATILDNITVSNPKIEARYAQINLSSSKVCPFLTEQNLCKIQKDLGEEYLSYACKNFPRINNYVNGAWESTAKMACPETARLALLEPTALKLEERDVYAEEWPSFFNKQIYPRKANDPNTYNSKLRKLFVEIIKNRTHPFAKRIWAVGVICRQLDQMINTASDDEIATFLESAATDIWDRPDFEPFNETVNPMVQIDVFRLLLESTIISDEISPRYQHCFYQLVEELLFSEEVSPEQRAERFESAYQKYYLPFMNDNPHILENYFINFIISTLFPFGSNLSPLDEYVLLAFRFIFVRLHLVGMSGHNKGLNPELIIQLVQSYARSMEHDQDHLNQIKAFLQATGRKDITYLL